MEVGDQNKVYHFKRAFLRNVGRGMKVQFGRSVNPSIGTAVDHYELEMPGYRCTENGPEIIEVDNIELETDVA